MPHDAQEYFLHRGHLLAEGAHFGAVGHGADDVGAGGGGCGLAQQVAVETAGLAVVGYLEERRFGF